MAQPILWAGVDAGKAGIIARSSMPTVSVCYRNGSSTMKPPSPT